MEKGVDPNAKDKDGVSSFHFACFKGQLDVVEFLLEKGADPNAPTDKGKESTPLHFACYSGDLKTVKLLVSLGVKVNEADINNSENLEIKNFLQSKCNGQYGCVIM